MKDQKVPLYIEAIGWYGPVALILAYALVSFDVITANSYAFQLLNLTGGAAIIVTAWAKKVLQSVVLNIFWCIIALVAIAQLAF